MKLRVDVDGREYLLDLVRSGDQCGYRITGSLDVRGGCSVEEISPGVFSVLKERSSFVVRLIETKDGVEAWIGSRKWLLAISDPRDRTSSDRRAAGHGPKEIRALMPGKVIKVLVSAGEEVKAGDGVIIVEAMKMQNEMKSPKNGRIRVIHVREGATVSAGVALLTVE